MPLSKLKYDSLLPYSSNRPHEQRGSKTFSKLATALSLCIGLSSWSQAQLPPTVEAALNRAKISTDDISLVIVPVNPAPGADGKPASNKSRLPEIIKPEVAKVMEAELPSKPDPDALPPETEELILAPTSSATQTSSQNSNQASKPSTNQTQHTATTTNASTATKTVVSPYALSPTTDTTVSSPSSTATDSHTVEFPIRHLADLPRRPASTMKLIPTFVALDLLGPDFVWFTQVYHTGFVSANTLYGDLIIKGSGDPKLTTQRLNKLLEQVQKAGIQHIKGDIVLDSSVFQAVTKDPAAFDNDPLRPYNASPDGLLINFSSVEITAVPLLNDSNKGLSKLYYKPRLADYDLPNTLATTTAGKCASARSSLAPVWQKSGLKFNRLLPESCGAHTFYIAYPDAKDFAKRVVKNQWLNLGNTLSGNIKFLGLGNTVSGDMINTESPIKTVYGSYLDMSASGDKQDLMANLSAILPSSPLPFVSYPSLPLSQQIYDINHYSNNVMTEQVTLTLPLYTKTNPKETNSDGSPLPKVTRSKVNTQSDYLKALATINNWWQQHLTTMPPAMSNGSGLCRDCSVTAENLAELLGFAYNHPDFNTYVNSLGIAGISGTITEHGERLPNSAAIGRAWIKTGTLNDVTSMAGYVHGLSGQDYVVVGIINGSSNSSQPLNTYEARYVLDTMLDWTAKQ
ncbi:D-alanyl-D-alanine carboxypeptidase/D-alanyl-D-alanine-endopeptidase [Psychrobacter sanguinis]|uniref:D-alanyl-D-alanine carboxypeptidase/D-alanyl-D-alanine-endopeptidase n=1 Tax=Psychrobacter sanguinis TaxID=861445 RepID=UPI00191B027D|nr:D-alanyl-D-alanine carboxypeptidase [Psychrobacter sanguinis]MCC3346281.1 D-alanyl-D-alanine carboxypeptidase [Psychrobacter sanguinis]